MDMNPRIRELKDMADKCILLLVAGELQEDMLLQSFMDVKGKGINDCADWLMFIKIGKERT